MVSKRKDNIPPHPESAFEWLLGPKSTFRLQLEIGVARAGATPLTPFRLESQWFEVHKLACVVSYKR